MQTFLPVNSINTSPKYLDNIRLNKQITEALQIYDTLIGKNKGWINHPAVKMWRGYEDGLLMYAYECFTEWIKRGGNRKATIVKPENYNLPQWFGDERLHSSHRARLLLKGEIDLILWRLRKKLKTKDDRTKFLKSLEIKDLRVISYEETLQLNRILDKLDFPENKSDNFYARFGWSESPSTNYWWPHYGN